MRTLRTVSELRQALGAGRPKGTCVGLVPTMGGFHAGHLSLIARARAECDVVVVSLFVNPAQFEDPVDLANYPRDERHDAELAAAHGVDLLFAPPPEELYPSGFSTTVSVHGITDRLEGAHRGPGHFAGVATVVLKLLNIVSPDVAYFGQKDAQQVQVLRRLVSDLDLPVRISVCPTVREDDGLAMSSRNVRLTADERARAASLFRALSAIRDAVQAGEPDPDLVRQRGLEVLDAAGVTVEYLELVSPASLDPVQSLDRELLAVVAGRVGDTRLIDNLPIAPPVIRPEVSAKQDAKSPQQSAGTPLTNQALHSAAA
jgi:pantoate--beta-alanine ligase